jgi:hypothetical protein
MLRIKPIEYYQNQKYGKLEILEDAGYKIYKKQRQRIVLCKCDCGIIKEIPLNKLRVGQKSCGCEWGSFKFGLWKNNYRLVNIWHGMISRCYDPANKRYKYYGQKGIAVCDEWRNNKAVFCSWALENGYKKNLSVDRIDGNKNYEPSNCRWTTLTENNRNRSCVKLTMEIAQEIRNAFLMGCFKQKEIAKGYKISSATVSNIINNHNWQ